MKIFETTIQHIDVWLKSADSTDRESIFRGLEEALGQVKEVLLGLESELNRIFGDPEALESPRLGRWKKVKYVFDEHFFEQCSDELHHWGSLIQLVLSVSQLYKHTSTILVTETY